MKVIVTGSAGFIGQHICRELREHGHDVIGVDRSISSIDLRAQHHVAALFREHGDADACFHLAAKVGRLFGEDDPMETIIDNAGMTALVAQACGDHDVRLLYASTSEVYGDNDADVCDEGDGPFRLPHNLYGITKGWGEDVAAHYAPIELSCLRFSMPYGPGLPAGRGRAAIINMLWQALHRKPIPVHRGAERSWCWIGDTVRAARLILEQTQGGAFNVGRDDAATSMLDVARLACDLTGASESLIELVDAPMNQTLVKRLATGRVRALGWTPEIELEEGMRRTLEWVRTLGSDGIPLEPVAAHG